VGHFFKKKSIIANRTYIAKLCVCVWVRVREVGERVRDEKEVEVDLSPPVGVVKQWQNSQSEAHFK